MAEDVAKKLLRMKKEIEEAKLEKAQIEGAIDQNMRRLKDDFDVSTLKAGKKKLQKLAEERDELQEKLDKQIEKLEAEYDWG